MIIGLRLNVIDEIFSCLENNKVHIISYQYDYYEKGLTKYELKLMIDIKKRTDLGILLRIIQSIEGVNFIENN